MPRKDWNPNGDIIDEQREAFNELSSKGDESKSYLNNKQYIIRQNWVKDSIKWLLKTDIHPLVNSIDAPWAIEETKHFDYNHDEKIKVSRRKLIITDGTRKVSMFLGFTLYGAKYIYKTYEKKSNKLQFPMGILEPNRTILTIDGEHFIRETYFDKLFDEDDEGFNDFMCFPTRLFPTKAKIEIYFYSHDEYPKEKITSEDRSLIFRCSSQNINRFYQNFPQLKKRNIST